MIVYQDNKGIIKKKIAKEQKRKPVSVSVVMTTQSRPI